ncbi:hypothetical protein AAVH_00133 [Aphelenchoides avenae]|nr:hypothetical protein AAVH_00133 [Aphelenchus avenae]
MALLEEHLRSRVKDVKFDEVSELNSSPLADDPAKAQAAVERLLKERKEKLKKRRNDLTPAATVDRIHQLERLTDQLDKRLHEHIRMLRQSEGSLSGTNTVLEYDAAKAKSDRLAEIIKARVLWTKTYEEAQATSSVDQNIVYQKLVVLQKCYDIISKYSPDPERERDFEKMKDEFLSWFSSAILFAIDESDAKQIESLKEKFTMLQRLPVFEQSFGVYAKNKVRLFIGDGEETTRTVWDILQEVFSIWRRCHRLADNFIGENGSKIVSDNLYDGVTSKWEVVLNIILGVICAAETPFAAAREIGTIRNDFLAYVEKEGDAHILSVCKRICQKMFDVMSDGYAKHVTSVLLCRINKISPPEKGSRSRQNWMMPLLDDVLSCMREMVEEAHYTFGSSFPKHVVSSFEQAIKELNSLLRNQDLLGIRRDQGEVKLRKGVQEHTEDRISAICVSGYLLNLVDDVNQLILGVYSDSKANEDPEDPQLISNRQLVERLNKKVVDVKVSAIAKAIVIPMSDEMEALKASAAGNTAESPKISLPSFSTPPHNYITTVGHGLLNIMNTISSFSSDRNFISAISNAAGKEFQDEEEADLWLLSEIGRFVMDAFCTFVGDLGVLHAKVARQFNSDVIFLLDALLDLRLQPTPQLNAMAESLKEHASSS